MSAIAAFIIIIANHRVARKRATLDLIMHIESDGDLIAARKKFIEIKASSVRSGTYGSEDKRDSEEAKSIRTVLNIHELTAVAIQEGVIDERVFRRWYNKTFIEDFKSMTGYVEAVRLNRKNNSIFKELECLANKWENDNAWYSSPGWVARKWTAIKKAWNA